MWTAPHRRRPRLDTLTEMVHLDPADGPLVAAALRLYAADLRAHPSDDPAAQQLLEQMADRAAELADTVELDSL